MTAVLFDTLRLSRSLRDKGHFTAEQAEALADALGEASQDNLATKLDIAMLKSDIDSLRMTMRADIDSLRTTTRADIDSLRTTTRADLSDMKADLLKWIVGAIGFQTVIIVGTAITLAHALVR